MMSKARIGHSGLMLLGGPLLGAALGLASVAPASAAERGATAPAVACDSYVEQMANFAFSFGIAEGEIAVYQSLLRDAPPDESFLADDLRGAKERTAAKLEEAVELGLPPAGCALTLTQITGPGKKLGHRHGFRKAWLSYVAKMLQKNAQYALRMRVLVAQQRAERTDGEDTSEKALAQGRAAYERAMSVFASRPVHLTAD